MNWPEWGPELYRSEVATRRVGQHPVRDGGPDNHRQDGYNHQDDAGGRRHRVVVRKELLEFRGFVVVLTRPHTAG